MTIREARERLRLDGLNRAWRTIMQGILVTVVFPALAAGAEVVRAAVQGSLSGETLEWTAVRDRAVSAAVIAALMAIAAYFHRVKLDPSRLPSAQPPAPPSQQPAVDARPMR